MVFRFRICRDNNIADTAQGWVIASSEIHAREVVGPYADVQKMPIIAGLRIPDGTVFVTQGELDGAV